MKKIYAINGSPRKNKNTATLLDKVLEGAKKSEPDVLAERIDLYSLKYTGCRSCFACKRKDGASYGKSPKKKRQHGGMCISPKIAKKPLPLAKNSWINQSEMTIL